MTLFPSQNITFIILMGLASLATQTTKAGWFEEQNSEIILPTIEGSELARHSLFSLPTCLFPVLPLGHFWNKVDGQWVVRKNQYAPQRDTVVVTYGPDADHDDNINFLTLIDNVNVQSFAHTLSEKTNISRSYPSRLNFNTANSQYDRGHCIDLRDTFPSSTRSNSNNDSRNYIPETQKFNAWWGRVGRNMIVRNLRKEGGAYAQFPFYGDDTHTTLDGTRIPKGVYFAEFIMNDISEGKKPVSLYEILWSTPPKNADELYAEPNRIFSQRTATYHRKIIPAQQPLMDPFSCYPAPIVRSGTIVTIRPYERWGKYYSAHPEIRRADEKSLLNFSRQALLERKDALNKLLYIDKCLEKHKNLDSVPWFLSLTTAHLEYLTEQQSLSPRTTNAIKTVIRRFSSNNPLDPDHNHRDTLRYFLND